MHVNQWETGFELTRDFVHMPVFFLEFLLSFTEPWRLESLLSSHSCSCPGSAWTLPGLRTQSFFFTIGNGILFDAFHYSFSLHHTFYFHSLTVVMNPSPLINMQGKLTCNSQANMLNAPRFLSVNLWKKNYRDPCIKMRAKSWMHQPVKEDFWSSLDYIFNWKSWLFHIVKLC